MKIKRYKLTNSELERKVISSDMTVFIKKYQKKLQLQENMRFGAKAQKVTFAFASKELCKRFSR